jgi:hypothetical protein
MSEPQEISGSGPPIWAPTPRTNIHLRGLRLMHGGPDAMVLPEHEHQETQIQTRFRKTEDGTGI